MLSTRGYYMSVVRGLDQTWFGSLQEISDRHFHEIRSGGANLITYYYSELSFNDSLKLGYRLILCPQKLGRTIDKMPL